MIVSIICDRGIAIFPRVFFQLSLATLTVEQARLDMAKIGTLTAAPRLGLGAGETTDCDLVTERLDLATAIGQWV